MRLAIVGTYPKEKGTIRGGVEYVLVNLVEGLRAHSELDIHVLSPRRDVTTGWVEQEGNVTLHFVPAARHWHNLTFGAVDNHRVRERMRILRPDVIHFQNAPTFAYTLGCRLPPCPVLLTLHGIICHETEFQRGIKERLRGWIRARQEYLALAAAPDLITLNPFVERSLRPLTKARMHRIDNPVNDRYFLKNGTAIPGRILFVGFISRLKNVMALLRAVARLRERHPEITARVAGGVLDPGYFSEVRRYLEDQDLHRHVLFLGHLPEERLLEEYAGCSLLVSTSLWENSPIAIQQAMAAGKPVVATRVGGVPYLVEEGRTGFLVDPEDLEGLADRIGRLLGDAHLRKAMGRAAGSEARERFAAGIVAGKTLRLYRELVTRRREQGEGTW